MFRTIRPWAALPILLCLALGATTAAFAQSEYTGAHCKVTCDGVGQEYAAALGTVVDAAWDYYHTELTLNLPEQVLVQVRTGNDRTQLWTDGDRFIYLDLATPDDLDPNRGYFHVYGMCQQLGMISMYSGLSTTTGLPDGVGPGWAHYLGSLATDAVWEQYGAKVWPVPYDYSGNGTKRLRAGCAVAEKDAMTLAACTFLAIGDQYGQRKVCQTMKGALANEPAGDKLMGRFCTILDARVAKGASAMVPDAVRKTQLTPGGNLVVIPRYTPTVHKVWTDAEGWHGYDDDNEEGMRSLAGGVHLVSFHVDGGGELKAVKIKGARYGYPNSDSNFILSVLDGDGNLIQALSLPFMEFEKRGEPLYWVELGTKGIVVPDDFYVMFDFRPTATDGVYVGYDADSTGHSYSGFSGGKAVPFSEGDWMIHVLVE